jgi:hypothetical protein
MPDRMKRLTEGLDEFQREQLGELDQLEKRLAAYAAPLPVPAAQQQLLDKLKPLSDVLNQEKADEWADPGWQIPKRSIFQWFGLIRTQTELLEKPFWWSSILVFLLGLLLALLDRSKTFPIMIITFSPILAALMVAFAFRPATQTLWELEKISPTRPLELLYARLVLIFGYNLLVATTLFLITWSRFPGMIFWRMLVIWLGPLLLLTGAALYLTVRWGTVMGTAVPLGFWSVLILLGWQGAVRQVVVLQSVTEWIYIFINSSNWLAVLCTAAFALGVLLLIQAGWFTTKDKPQWN